MKTPFLLLAAFALSTLTAYAATFDAYGGWNEKPCSWPNSQATTISNIVTSSGTTTVTVTSSANIKVNMDVMILGVADSFYNSDRAAKATFRVTAVPDGTHFSFTGLAGSHGASSGGSAQPARFYTEKITGRWYLCTPTGHAFFMQGVAGIDTDNGGGNDYQGINLWTNIISVKYNAGGGKTQLWWWALATLAKMQAWGLNATGEYADAQFRPTCQSCRYDTGTITTLIPETALIKVGWTSARNVNSYGTGPVKGFSTGLKGSVANMSAMGYQTKIFTEGVDPFDPLYTTYVDGYINTGVDTKSQLLSTRMTSVNASYVMGLMTDDSDNMGMTRCGTDFQDVRQGVLQGAPPTGNCASHFGYLTAIHAPNVAVSHPGLDELSAGSPYLYATPTFSAKSEFATWLQGTADSGPNYATIGAMNTAWGSSYTSFGSDAVDHAAVACSTGDGTAGPYTCTLGAGIDPNSLQIFAGGVLKGGDSGCLTANGFWCTAGTSAFTPTTTNALLGSGTSSGTINLSTGAVSITFSAAVGVGVSITASYKTGGWGVGGGVLDEDGSHAWMPTNVYFLTGGSGTPTQVATRNTDLENFLYHLAKKYWSVQKTKWNLYYPGFLFFGPTGVGTTCAPPRAGVLKAAGEVLDVVPFNTLPCGIADDASRITFVATHAGDKPWFEWEGFTAQPDSYFYAVNTNPAGTEGPAASTQPNRGTEYQAMITRHLATPYVAGFLWWNFTDQRGENTNWGYETYRDNAYDGHETATTIVACSAPIATYNCGGEQAIYGAPYGNFLSSVIPANAYWYGGTPPPTSSVAGATLEGGTIQ